MALSLRPITQKSAFSFVAQNHRHHRPPVGSLWQHAVVDGERLVGVAIVGRPVARALDDGCTAEVIRLCTDGTRNACSLLYAAARRAAMAKGYRRGLTYILESEAGTTLRAAGWSHLWNVDGRSWDCPSRPRLDLHPTDNKQAWGWGDWSAHPKQHNDGGAYE
ncbi:XF1762 family protein [Achromobacter denitrificans]|uniref:XF1762 family protein n=1 Tax=Achromobacter denitrificans TaxID=32002 RepID=A0ABZ3G8K4_ACHDE